MSDVKLTIDGRAITGVEGQTILEVARANGIKIPTLCYDERVKVYGSCGLCVVETEGSNKLFRACATQIAPGMTVLTNTPRLRASRKMTLELLLSDHAGDCRPPCVKACPAHTDCQGYVGLIANGQHREAVALIKEMLPLPASIGRVCPHPCETACRRKLVEDPISIAFLKGFVGDIDLASDNPYMPPMKPSSGKKAAVIGGGPAGLTAAFFLAKEGHAVTIYEAMPKAGGMLRYGIPEYRLPKAILDKEIDLIARMGVTILTNTRIGKDITLEQITSQYDSVFVGIGAWIASEMGCKGEDLPGVLGGIDFLQDAALNGTAEIGEKVAVVGGGNTAMDAARTAVRLGAKEVMVLYRRTRGEMPAEDIEVEEAMEEGVDFRFLVAPLEVIAENGKVTGILMQKMQLGEPDSSGRRRPVPVEGADEIIPVDTVISAIGQKVNPAGFESIKLSKWGTLDANDDVLITNLPGVFAGGDAVTGPGIAIEAIAQGKRAADMMIRYLDGEAIEYKEPFRVERTGLTAEDFADMPKAARIKMPHVSPTTRRTNFNEVNLGFEEAAAIDEAKRCLECGCGDYFECQLIAYATEYDANPARIQGAKHQERFVDDHPFIARDSDKCILCGLCVRICEETMGITALGLVKRGFETVVKPEFNISLKESDCISCGQCVTVCPTGALLERMPIAKYVPLEAEKTESVCSFCGTGCQQVIETRGNMVLRSLPAQDGLLCRKGRFGFEGYTGERLNQPMLRKEGKLVPVSVQEAIQYVADATNSIKDRFGKDSLSVSLAANSTVEEACQASFLACEAIGTSNISTFTRNAGRALKYALGDGGSTIGFAALDKADLIIMVGSLNESQIAAIKIRQAVNNGAKLAILHCQPTLVDDVADLMIPVTPDTAVLKEIFAALAGKHANEQFIAERTIGFAELKQSFSAIQPGEAAQKLAALYAAASSAVIVADGGQITGAGTEMLANIALAAGKVGTPGNGILIVSPGSNSTGLWKSGVTGCGMHTAELIQAQEIKGLLVFGEDPAGADILDDASIKKLELLVVSASSMNKTAELAHVVFPASLPFETAGTYVSSDNTVQTLNQVTLAPGLTNTELFAKLTEALSGTAYQVPSTVIETEAVKYLTGFAFEDGKARFTQPDAGKNAFRPAQVANPALIKFNTLLISEGLKDDPSCTVCGA